MDDYSRRGDPAELGTGATVKILFLLAVGVITVLTVIAVLLLVMYLLLCGVKAILTRIEHQ